MARPKTFNEIITGLAGEPRLPHIQTLHGRDETGTRIRMPKTEGMIPGLRLLADAEMAELRAQGHTFADRNPFQTPPHGTPTGKFARILDAVKKASRERRFR